MSSDRQRLTRSIQRIAESAPGIRKFLEDADNKGGKPASAGVGGGAGSEEGSNTSSETRICCDGSVSDDPNPGVDERDTGNDQDGLDPDNPADIDLSGGCLTGVTDCDTGDAICFCGDNFIPPDGWDEPNDPPPEPSYEEGYYWRTVRDGDENHTDVETACLYLESITANTYSYYVLNANSSGAECYNPNGDPFNAGGVNKVPCDGEPDPVCSEDPPKADSWPSDGCTNLAIKNGTIVGSKYDPENDGSYSAPRDEIQLCDGANQISLSPSGSSPGGYKTIDAINGGDGFLYNKKHEQIARISGDAYSDPNV